MHREDRQIHNHRNNISHISCWSSNTLLWLVVYFFLSIDILFSTSKVCFRYYWWNNMRSRNVFRQDLCHLALWFWSVFTVPYPSSNCFKLSDWTTNSVRNIFVFSFKDWLPTQMSMFDLFVSAWHCKSSPVCSYHFTLSR